MGERTLLRMQVSQAEADALESAIREAFSQQGQPLAQDAMLYSGPAPGAFGFGQGVLDFFGDAWREFIKVPDAVKALAKGIADYLRLRGSSQTIVFTVVDGQVNVSFKATGKAVASDPAEIAKALTDALQKAQPVR